MRARAFYLLSTRPGTATAGAAHFHEFTRIFMGRFALRMSGCCYSGTMLRSPRFALAFLACIAGSICVSAKAAPVVTEAFSPSSGGGELDWWDSLFVIGVLLAGRRHGRRGPPRP